MVTLDSIQTRRVGFKHVGDPMDRNARCRGGPRHIASSRPDVAPAVMPSRIDRCAAGSWHAVGEWRLHDNPFHFEALLRMARLEEGEDRHLILHELIHGEHLMNGMDFSYRMLLKTADLVRAHPACIPCWPIMRSAVDENPSHQRSWRVRDVVSGCFGIHLW